LVTLPQFFKNHGYYAAGGGKVHHHTDGFNPPDQWNEYFDLVRDQDLVVDYFKRRGENRRYFTERMPRHPNDSLDWGPMEVDDLDMGDGQTIRWATEFLARKHEKPFFLAVGLFQPHLPFYAPGKYFDALPLNRVELPINKEGDLDDIPKGGQEMAASRREDLRMIEEFDDLKHCMQSYLAGIAHADTLVGILIESLDKSGYRENTIIAFWSDHGYAFGEKDHFAKDTLWERSTHVPFIMVAPGVTTPGTRSSRPVDLTCLYPTLTQLCGLTLPADLDGIDITPLLKDPHLVWNQPAIIDFLFGNTAIRTENWRYIRYDEGRAGEELYNLQTDPEEWDNLIESRPEMAQPLKDWLPKEYTEEAPSKSAYRFNETNYTWTRKE
ncbi:MAG: sulfatase-like hydrolase/transferase, partial [Verrucomicrobiae bacterium]|nr:sulfatase-like hydrolase/transferase [Verrucomicrobiae bacterium]